MAQFYGHLQGNRGGVSRLGSKGSGIYGHIRGWNIGIKVSGYYDMETDQDIFTVSLTGGSGNSSVIKELGTYKEKEIK